MSQQYSIRYLSAEEEGLLADFVVSDFVSEDDGSLEEETSLLPLEGAPDFFA